MNEYNGDMEHYLVGYDAYGKPIYENLKQDNNFQNNKNSDYQTDHVHKINIENYFIGVDAYGNPRYVNLRYWNGDFSSATALSNIEVIQAYANAGYASKYTEDYKFLPYATQNNNYNRHSIVPGSYEKGPYRAAYQGYIYNRSSDQQITILMASTPDNIDESIGINVSQEAPVGSTQPVIIYSSTGARTIAFSFKVYADYLPNNYGSVKDYVTAMKQLCYPSVAGDYISPPECEFSIPGINIIGIVTNFSVSWSGTFKSGNPEHATISMTITETKQVVGGKVNV